MAYAHLVRHCLSQWITMILTVIAPRSKNTFVELLCGCMISPEGWVTRVIGAIGFPLKTGQRLSQLTALVTANQPNV